MNKILTLEDLTTITPSPEEYGLKLEGIAKLVKIVRSITDSPYSISIPQLFGVPTNVSLENKEIRKEYQKLTSKFDVPKIILARSSDQQEKPGKFETHSSLYDPRNPEVSFKNWISAAQKVRESGARALIGQVFAGDLINFPYTYDEKSSDISEKTIASFGGDQSSFVANSSNYLNGEHPSILACFGAASKLVRGDNDITVLLIRRDTDFSWGFFEAVNLRHNYRMSSCVKDVDQRTIDVITLEDPTKITTLDYHLDKKGIFITEPPISLPFPLGIRYTNQEIDDFRPLYLLALIKIIKDATDKHIEVEGSVSEEGISLFQLREYELPKKQFQGFSKIPEQRVISSYERGSIGFNKFVGDLYISRKQIKVPKNAIFMYLGEEHYSEPEKFKRHPRMIFDTFDSNGHYAGIHSFGHTVQTMVELEKLGVDSIALEDGHKTYMSALGNFADRIKVSDDRSVMIIKDVTVECNGEKAQIYFNK